MRDWLQPDLIHRSGMPWQVRQPKAGRVKRYIPFSDGRRDCVGQALARMNYMSTLARLLGNFHFELAPEVCGFRCPCSSPPEILCSEHMHVGPAQCTADHARSSCPCTLLRTMQAATQ